MLRDTKREIWVRDKETLKWTLFTRNIRRFRYIANHPLTNLYWDLAIILKPKP